MENSFPAKIFRVQGIQSICSPLSHCQGLRVLQILTSLHKLLLSNVKMHRNISFIINKLVTTRVLMIPQNFWTHYLHSNLKFNIHLYWYTEDFDEGFKYILKYILSICFIFKQWYFWQNNLYNNQKDHNSLKINLPYQLRKRKSVYTFFFF